MILTTVLNGKLQLSGIDKKLIKHTCHELEGKQVKLTIEEFKKNRSNDANRYYFGVIVKFLCDIAGYSKSEAHELLRNELIPAERKEGPFGPFEFRKSTADMSVKEFCEYVNAAKLKIEEFYEMTLPPPLYPFDSPHEV